MTFTVLYLCTIINVFQSSRFTNMKIKKKNQDRLYTLNLEQATGGRKPTDLRPVDETLATLRTFVRHPLGIMGNAEQSVRSDLGSRML